jgi:hypothetical protein
MFSRLCDSEQQNCEPKQKQPNHHIIAAVPHLLLLVLGELPELPQDAACMMNSLQHQEQLTINRNEICWHRSQITIFFLWKDKDKKCCPRWHKSQIIDFKMCKHKSQEIFFSMKG